MQKTRKSTVKTAKKSTRAAKTTRSVSYRIDRTSIETIHANASKSGKVVLANLFPSLFGVNYSVGDRISVSTGKHTYQMIISEATNRRANTITLVSLDSGKRWKNQIDTKTPGTVTQLEMAKLVGSRNIKSVRKIS